MSTNIRHFYINLICKLRLMYFLELASYIMPKSHLVVETVSNLVLLKRINLCFYNAYTTPYFQSVYFS